MGKSWLSLYLFILVARNVHREHMYSLDMYSMEVQSINGIEESSIYQGRVYRDGIYSDIYMYYMKYTSPYGCGVRAVNVLCDL